MRKRKFSFILKHKPVIFFVLATIFVVSLVSWLGFQNKKREPNGVVLGGPIQKTFYPTLHSSYQITSNAVNSDPRFKNVSLISNETLLSNVISSVKKSGFISESEGLENGTWLWTPLLDITPSYRTSIISGARKNNIKTIYLSIDSYLDIYVLPDGFEKEEKKKAFILALEQFIAEARKNNITVDAEAGWKNWAERGHSYKALAVLDFAIEYNKTHKEKLRGFQYDVEPYLLPLYQLDKKNVLRNFVNLIDQTVIKLDGSDLKFSVVIPDFYDGASGETPKFNYRGVSRHTFDHLLSILERREGSELIIMSYRNFSKGNDGSIDISREEINKANEYGTKVIIAQETGDVPPPYITFNKTTRFYYDKQIALIRDAFSSDKSFGGIATHYINAFLELK